MTTDAHWGHIPAWTLGDRMAKALKNQGISVQEMADYLRVSRQSISTWTNDRGRPPHSVVRLWALRTGVPLEWLETGNAPEGGPGGGTEWVAGGSNPKPTD